MYGRGNKRCEATCTPVVTSVVKIRAGIMFASEATCTPVV